MNFIELMQRARHGGTEQEEIQYNFDKADIFANEGKIRNPRLKQINGRIMILG